MHNPLNWPEAIRKVKELEKENAKLQSLVKDIYPALAGLVIAAQQAGEKETEKRWNDYCKKIEGIVNMHKNPELLQLKQENNTI